MARSMFKDKSLPNKFWVVIVSATIYILNRLPTKTVSDVTPYQVWNKRKTKVDFFEVFGCIAYTHLPAHNKKEKIGEK